MQTAETLNPDQISQFLKLGDTIEFAGHGRAERYAFAQQLLAAQEYARQGRKQRGAIRAYLGKMTGLSLPQTARLIQMYIATGAVELRGYRRHEFVSKYTDGDVRLLANVDRAHERLSGPAAFYGGSTRGSASRNTRGWRRSRCLICTICATVCCTASMPPCTCPRGPRR
jgi:hypothetical protein